jgi:hypothetical protein
MGISTFSQQTVNTGLANPAGSGNVIINGGFDIWQRGTSFSSGGYTADRFFAISDAVITASRQTFVPGEISGASIEPTFFHRIEKSSGGGFSTIGQRIEGVRTLANSAITVSFWAKANTSQTLFIRPRQEFGSGGSSSVTLTQKNVTLTSTWTRYTFTFDMPSIAGKTIGSNDSVLLEIFTTGSGAVTWDIWGVQLEAGTVATPFRRNAPSIQAELAACQRYYYRMNAEGLGFASFGIGLAVTASTARVGTNHPVQMRVRPNFVETFNVGFYDGISGSSATSPTLHFTTANVNTTIFNVSGLVAKQVYNFMDSGNGNGFIGFSAEL